MNMLQKQIDTVIASRACGTPLISSLPSTPYGRACIIEVARGNLSMIHSILVVCVGNICRSPVGAVTGNQIRVARIALCWSVQDLSVRTGVPTRTLKCIDADDGVPSASANTFQTLQNKLGAAGIGSIGTLGDGPGIRIWQPIRAADGP